MEPARFGDDPDGVVIVYDGECPVCGFYVRHLRLKRSVGALELIDARAHPELVAALVEQGYPLDTGMVVRVGNQLYHGAAAIHVLALMSGPHDWLNYLNSKVFQSPTLSRVLYPPLVFGRRILLWILGRRPLQEKRS